MDVSTPPSLDLACPQAEAGIEKYLHMFRDRGVDKIKYGHEGMMSTTQPSSCRRCWASKCRGL